MKQVRKIIEIDEELCDGCGDCVTACAEGAIQIIDGVARVVNDVFCDGLGACIGECPLGALKIIEKEADAFDEEAVKEHLASLRKEPRQEAEPPACGCPSSTIQHFTSGATCESANRPRQSLSGESALTHWPIQIHLVPPTAPFLKNADLLITADCVPAACPDFHDTFLKNRTMLLGCPKLDNAEAYIEKFAAIFSTADIKRITAIIMEVPCCSGLPMIIKKALEISGKRIPLEEITISIQEGKVLQHLRN